MSRTKAVIIGSGIAGMATAIRLACAGFEVTVLEKNNEPGGKLTSFRLGEYTFDRGPSLFTQPGNIRELFNLAGYRMEDFLSVQRVDLANTYFYEDGAMVKAWAEPEKLDEEIHRVLGEKQGVVLRYLRDAETIYKNIGTIFINHPLNKTETWLHPRILSALKVTRRQYLFNSLDEVNRRYFEHPKTVQLFNRFATYNGSNPYVAPGMLSMIPHLEHNQGTFYPAGGMISITRALTRLASALGVKFVLGEEVTSIKKEGKTIRGVRTKNLSIDADIVISNMDAYYTYSKLLNDSRKAGNILKQERSSSALIFYWGIKTALPQLHLHNILFAKDYREEFNDLFLRKKVHTDPTVYINNTSVMEPGMAPAGHSNWFVMVNAPAATDFNPEKEIPRIRKNVLDKIRRILGTDVSSEIEHESVWTPIGIDSDTFSYQGSLYGTSSNSRSAAFMRHSNESGSIKGLYFTGGSVHPGGGIPLCLAGAKITSELILKQFNSSVVA